MKSATSTSSPTPSWSARRRAACDPPPASCPCRLERSRASSYALPSFTRPSRPHHAVDGTANHQVRHEGQDERDHQRLHRVEPPEDDELVHDVEDYRQR